ncbi:MAG: acetaldehyde dehydrogenase (acetylating) [Oscillospiraceae bacterium]
MPDDKIKCAIIGPGNIGLDLMYKIKNRGKNLQLDLVVNNAMSERLQLAQKEGFDISPDSIDAVLERDDVKIVFDCTMAEAHQKHAPLLKKAGKVAIDLTPAAVGGYVCPAVNLGEHMDEDNINLITCGGQATIPIVAAINKVAPVSYAEIVACIARESAGPGTRESIDEFTITTAEGLRVVGGAKESKAIILLNPAQPPMIMNNTIYCVVDKMDEAAIEKAVLDMVEVVKGYVPGYTLKIPPTFDGNMVTVMIEVEGAGDFLPKYSGNLDIETSAALAIAEQIATNMLKERGAS